MHGAFEIEVPYKRNKGGRWGARDPKTCSSWNCFWKKSIILQNHLSPFLPILETEYPCQRGEMIEFPFRIIEYVNLEDP